MKGLLLNRYLIAFVLLCLIGPSFLWNVKAGPVGPAPSTNLIHIGFSARIFAGFNENDANAAVKTWVKTICLERNIKADPTPAILRGTEAIAKAFADHKVDCMTMTMDEYWDLRNQVSFGRMVSNTRRQGQCTEKYILLVRKESKIQSLKDLQGCSLLIMQNPITSMGNVWLDTILMEQGFSTAPEFCGQITGNPRLTKVVLPVFFRKSDACLITQASFETLGEMNPQLIQQMRCLAISPPLVPSGSFFRADYPNSDVDSMIEQLTQIHTTTAGQQLLRVFQTEQICEARTNELNSTLEFLSKHQKLWEATHKFGGASESSKEEEIQ